MAPVVLKIRKQEVEVGVDEHPRPETKIADLTKLKSIFQKDGLVTAGSASVSLKKNGYSEDNKNIRWNENGE